MPLDVMEVASGRYELHGRAWVHSLRCALCGECGRYVKTECCPDCEELALALHSLILAEREKSGEAIPQ